MVLELHLSERDQHCVELANELDRSWADTVVFGSVRIRHGLPCEIPGIVGADQGLFIVVASLAPGLRVRHVANGLHAAEVLAERMAEHLSRLMHRVRDGQIQGLDAAAVQQFLADPALVSSLLN